MCSCADKRQHRAGAIIVAKHRYSGFFETDLNRILSSLGITTLIVTDCTTSVCGESTVQDAMFGDYTCVLLMRWLAKVFPTSFQRRCVPFNALAPSTSSRLWRG
jgi:nicotinamidase-related amidase